MSDLPQSSDWLPLDEQAVDYLTGATKTATGRRKIGVRFLRKEVERGRLRAARIGLRSQLFVKRAWLDQYAESLCEPVMVQARRRA